jgi:hypothetical protein
MGRKEASKKGFTKPITKPMAQSYLEIGDKVLVSWNLNGVKYSFEAFIDQINKTEFGTSFIFNKVKKDGTPSSVRRHSPAEEYTVVKIPKSNN